MVEQFGVSRNTLRKSLQELVATGWAESIPNRGVKAKLGPNDPKQRVVGFVDYASFEPHLFFFLSSLLQASGLVLTHVDSEALGTEGALEYCAEQGFAGAFVWSKTVNPDRARIERVLQTMPVIAVDHALRGIQSDVVVCDTYEGAIKAVRHLASLGWDRIGITGMLDSLDTTQERFGGYLEGMFTSGLSPRVEDFHFIRTSGSTCANTRGLVRRLSEPDRPNALLVMQDHTLEEVLSAVEEAGLSIPHDIAIVMIGTPGYAGFDTTTVAFDWKQIAGALMDRLHHRLAEPGSPATRVVIPSEFIVRGSCGATVLPRADNSHFPASSVSALSGSDRGMAAAASGLPVPPANRPYRQSDGTSKSHPISSTSR